MRGAAFEEQKEYRVQVARSASGGISTGFQTFHVKLEERMTVLDALFQIQRHQDASLSFRCACRVGMCGTCAMSINGIPRLACKTRPQLLETEPCASPRCRTCRSSRTWWYRWIRFSNSGSASGRRYVRRDPNSTELARMPADSQYARHTPAKRDCITCGACYAACGIKSSSGEYLGPAAINKAFLRLMDPRDIATSERLHVLNQERGGIWRCHTQFNCTAVCPKAHHLDRSIARLKRACFSGEIEKSMKSTSMTAHVIQRTSGVLLLIYLFLHVHTIHELATARKPSTPHSPLSASRLQAARNRPVGHGDSPRPQWRTHHAARSGHGTRPQRRLFWASPSAWAGSSFWPAPSHCS